MRMVSKNIYVSEQDLPLIQAASRQAGSLSAAVVEGLKLYLRTSADQADGFKPIELKVNEHGQVVRKRFTGKRLFRFDQQMGSRRQITEIYRSRKGKFALYQRSMPNWSTATGISGDRWTSPGPDQSVSRTLTIFDSLPGLAVQLPPDLADEVTAASQNTPVEELDI